MRKPLAGRARISPRFSMHPPSPSFVTSAAVEHPACSASACRCLSALLLLAAITFPCAVLYRATSPTSFPFQMPSPPWCSGPPVVNFGTGSDPDAFQLLWISDIAATFLLNEVLRIALRLKESEDVRLEKVLKEAAMENKTVILTTLNAAWASPGSIIDIFIEGFRIGDGTRILLDHLDIDILWFRNPLPQLSPDEDFQIACDYFKGDALDLQNIPNGGFNYVKSNNRTIEFYKFWHASRENYPGYHDQDVLNIIKNDPFLMEIGIRIRFLSTAFFGGLCEPSRDFNKVCTMHANCCIGLRRKVHDLRVMLDDWRTYMSLPWKIKRNGAYSWRVPQNCR
ncbi:hypothetical protein Cni_G18524 [Canna indica]|uniref:Nucleotide-diphospho-sugar transferase domain-containing protein n=1 Tax=Canna indica TaxID=4628 RepID=A0AAQ3QEF3_9LILI|nr:hypothetical protein Cni_G18524 [Canna indica]